MTVTRTHTHLQEAGLNFDLCLVGLFSGTACSTHAWHCGSPRLDTKQAGKWEENSMCSLPQTLLLLA